MSSPHISVCIPVYEMNGFGTPFLAHNLNSLANQDFEDFEVIVADQSRNDEIKHLCAQFASQLNIKHLVNSKTKRQASANTNYAMKRAEGKIIKILFQDDYLYTPNALSILSNRFDLSKDHWSVTASEHSYDGETVFRPFFPKYNERIHFGKNTISSPSVLALNNTKPVLEFDENLIWLMDVDYYKRCHDKFGPPLIIEEISVVNRLHSSQVSSGVSKRLVRRELRIVKEKNLRQMSFSDRLYYLKRIARVKL